jgi:hypothetical protein
LPNASRIRSALAWAVAVVAIYFVALAVWWLAAPAYLSVLARLVEAFERVVGGSSWVRVLAVPGHGLAVFGEWRDALAIPQTILGADVALAVALVIASSSATVTIVGPDFRRTIGRATGAFVLVMLGHVATIAAQIAVTRAHPPAHSAAKLAWDLWVVVYQGKALPLAVWLLICGLPLRRANVQRGDRRAK